MTKPIVLLAILFSFLSHFSLSQTWNIVPSGTTKHLNAISFPTSSVGYIAGEDSLLLKSIDGGQTWSPIDMSNFPFIALDYDFIDVQFVSEMVGYIVVGPYTGTFKTTDGGITWTVVNSIYACYNASVYLIDENNGFLGGSGCFSGEIINKLDTGSWAETNINPQFIQSNGIVNNFDFYDDSLGLATSTRDYFFRTTNGGTTWDTISNTLSQNDSLTSVLFVDSLRVLATYLHGVNGGFGVLISNDAGLSWQQHTNSATFHYPSMYATEKSGHGHVYIGGRVQNVGGAIVPGMIYESDQQMAFWTYHNVAETIHDFGSYSDSVVFAIGENGYIIVNQDLSTLSVEELMPLETEVYPNPSKGEINVRISNHHAESIHVIDMKGKVVYPEIEIVQKGSEWKIMDLEKGVFFVKIVTNSGIYSKKVVIF